MYVTVCARVVLNGLGISSLATLLAVRVTGGRGSKVVTSVTTAPPTEPQHGPNGSGVGLWRKVEVMRHKWLDQGKNIKYYPQSQPALARG